MVTRKKAAKKSTKKSTKKASKKRASRPTTGEVPPYGEVIRGAVARGDVRKMKDVASSARKWVSEVQAALAQLDSAIKEKESGG